MKKPSTVKISAIQTLLLNWFQKNQRPLPWRKTYDPYQVWISEIMLQQTQVVTALPYFDRWMSSLPTIESVAQAPEDKILKLWEGLGYYSRARNIQKAAKIIMENYAGKFPSDYESILALPGIGQYTAAAISSIAFKGDCPVVDGNVIRVLSRLLAYTGNTREAGDYFWKQMTDLLPKGKAREFNQAVMEFGALICKPANPDCANCVLQKNCEAYKKNIQHKLPDRGVKKEKEKLIVSIGVIKKDGKIFIQKRNAKGLLGGLWEFPGGKSEKNEKPDQTLHREIEEEIGIRIKNIRPLRVIHHAYTRYKVELHCFSADYDSGEINLQAATDFKWVSQKELPMFPFPAANVQLISDLLKN